MAQQAFFETIKTLANGGIGSNYAKVGSPLAHPSRLVCITNNTAGDMMFSTDGVNDMVFVPTKTSKIFPICTNRLQSDQQFAIPQNTQFWVKQVTAPSSGDVYVESIYGG